MPLTYERPDLPAGATIAKLVSSDLKAQELTPKTRVIIINRGREPYCDKYDGHDYVVPPGLGEVEYEVANHFRERSVVPGSRDPQGRGQDVFIAVLGQDPPEKCVPFSDEECARYGVAVEALDRSNMESEADRSVVTIKTSAARARTAGGSRRRPDISTQQNDSQSPAPDALTPPVGGDAALAGHGEPVGDDEA